MRVHVCVCALLTALWLRALSKLHLTIHTWENQAGGENELGGLAKRTDRACWLLVGVGLCVAKWLGACPVAGSALAVAASNACPGHRALAPGRIGRLSMATPGRTRYLFTLRWLGALPITVAGRTPRPHRAHYRYLCNLRDWAHSQSYAAGLPAVCHKWSGALPPQVYATTRNSPRLGALPGLRWQRERLQCQRHLTSVYAICPAGLAPWLLLVSSQNKEKTFVMVYRQPK